MKSPKMKRLLVVACVSLAACAVTSGRCAADTVAYTTSGVQSDLAAYGLSGFEFTVSQDINVTELGFTGISLGGGDAPHVTLFNASSGLGSLTQMYDTGNILSSTTSYGAGTPGTAAPSYVSVGTPIELVTGQTYLITAPAYWAATYATGTVTPNSIFASSSFLTTGPGNWSGWANSGYNFSNLTAAVGAIPTEANFEYTVAPEPSTYIMLGLGLAALVVMRRRSTEVSV